MNNLNSIIIEGNLTKDASLSTFPSGATVCSFSVAVNRFYKNANGENEQEVSFFDVETWGTLATICSKNGSKGRGVRLVGRLKQSRFTDSNGKTSSKIFIVAEHVEFQPSPKQAANSVNEEKKEEVCF